MHESLPPLLMKAYHSPLAPWFASTMTPTSPVTTMRSSHDNRCSWNTPTLTDPPEGCTERGAQSSALQPPVRISLLKVTPTDALCPRGPRWPHLVLSRSQASHLQWEWAWALDQAWDTMRDSERKLSTVPLQLGGSRQRSKCTHIQPRLPSLWCLKNPV